MKYKREGLFVFGLLVLMTFVLVWGFSGAPRLCGAQEKEKELPEREIAIYTEYTGVVIPSDKDEVSVDLIVANRGKSDEDVGLNFTTVPEGWKARIKTYSFDITGVHAKSDSTKTVTLKLEPGKEIKPAKYDFAIQGQSADGLLRSVARFSVTVKEKEEGEEKKSEGVKITTSYPVLRGPTDAKFEFSIEVESKVEKDTVYNLSAQGPQNWEINFKPAYEDKYFSSLRLKANQSQSMAVEVKPFPWEKPGEYPIVVKVSAPEAKGEATLTVVLTGTQKLDVGTASGLISLEAVRGEQSRVSFYVKNSGSAALTNVSFLSIKPENWKVEFKPEKFDVIEPQELKEVELSVTPAEQALVGDYSVGVNVEAGRVTKPLEFRVTVKASTAWGWIGVGIIALVVVGLVFLFVRLGRR